MESRFEHSSIIAGLLVSLGDWCCAGYCLFLQSAVSVAPIKKSCRCSWPVVWLCMFATLSLYLRVMSATWSLSMQMRSDCCWALQGKDRETLCAIHVLDTQVQHTTSVTCIQCVTLLLPLQMRIGLARLLLGPAGQSASSGGQGGLLLLDEPTNHLDK